MKDINTWLEDLGINRESMIESIEIIKEEAPHVDWEMESDEWQLPVLVAEINNMKLHIIIDAEDYSNAIINIEKRDQYRVMNANIYDVKNIINLIDINNFKIEYECDLPF